MKMQWHEPVLKELDVRLTADSGLKLGAPGTGEDSPIQLMSSQSKHHKSKPPKPPHHCW